MNRRESVEISHDCTRFLLTHNPSSTQLESFIEVKYWREVAADSLHGISLRGEVNQTCSNRVSLVEDLKEHGAKTLVRVCAPTYDKALLEQEGIQVLVRSSCFFLSALRRFFFVFSSAGGQ